MPFRRWLPTILSLVVCLPAIALVRADGITLRLSDREAVTAEHTVGTDATETSRAETAARPVSLLQEQPQLTPELATQPAATPPPAAAQSLSAALFGDGEVRRSLLPPERRTVTQAVGTDFVLGSESKVRAATDAGSLLGRSPNTAIGIGVQRRSPIVTDPRIRGSRIGTLGASGSYWVPARIDLDTVLSKIDTRNVQDIVVMKGPYSAQYGPGFSVYDVEMLPAPRFDGYERHGSTGLDYGTNGEHWYGRQSIWTGDVDWGARVSYGHHTANDYSAGSGLGIPSSYNSRDFDVALGQNLSDDASIEFHYLRLDQTNVELPGQAFDIDFLVTDGFDARYLLANQVRFDRLKFDLWYNRTRFEGTAQNAGKRRTFPYYNFLNFEGFTDVNSTSLGSRATWEWDFSSGGTLSAGVDSRYLKQNLNEITSGRNGPNVFTNANSPVPKSDSANPGLFVEYSYAATDRLTVRTGGRLDWMNADILANPATLNALGTSGLPIEQILGTDDFSRHYQLYSGFVTGKYSLNSCWTLNAATGYAERPPNMTEMYAVQPFMFVLQNGLNTVTGDPALAKEKLWQADASLDFDNGLFRMHLGGFHALIHDYITYENLRIFPAPPFGQIEQVSLRYVNTDRATISGVEFSSELDLTERISLFGNVHYLEGTDETRNGNFATLRATPNNPVQQIAGLSRGFFSGVPGDAEEPLPSMPPLESQVGVRLRPCGDCDCWGVEFAARMVDRQDRVATSLLETEDPGFTVFDVHGFWNVTDDLLLVGGIDNLTNRTYREYLDFRSQRGIQVFQPGIQFYFGTELTY